MIVVGVDVGTSSLKAVAVRPDGRLVRERTVRYPTRLSGSSAEQDARSWWSAALGALPAVVYHDPVVALGVTSQAPTLVAVDRRGEPVGPALTWIDRRAVAEAAEIAAAVGPERNPADPFFATAKLLWWRRHRPTELREAGAVLAANGFLVHRLTGVGSLDESTAGLFQGWNGKFHPALSRLGVPIELLPPVVPCIAVVGEVTAEAARDTALPTGTPVVAGAIDAVGAALEAGVLGPEDGVVEMTGFSTVTVQAIERDSLIPGLIHTRHGVPGVDLALSAQVSTGSVVDWLVRLTGRWDLLERADALPPERPGRVLVVPSFAGERTPTWDAAARGVILGLDLDVTAADLLLGVFEGVALALRDDLDRVAAATGLAGPVRAVGGGARSAAWLQVKADVLGRPVEVPRSGHGAAIGAALLAGLTTGVWSTPQELRLLTSEVDRRHLPELRRHAAYTQRLVLFREVRRTMSSFNRSLRSLL